MSDKWSNEYWEDYGAHERQKAKGKMRGLAGAVTGAAIGSAIPIVGTTAGAIGGYIVGVASAHTDRVENNGRCPSTREVVEEAGRTLIKLAKNAGKY